MKFQFIAIDGPPGLGKRRLATLLADHYGGLPLLECSYEHPFFDNCMKQPQRYGLQAQIYFLIERANLLKSSAHPNLFADFHVSNFSLEKDLIYATFLLDEEDFAIYRKVKDSIARTVPSPDLFVYLYSNPNQLFQKLKSGRSEYWSDFDRFKELCHRYNDHYVRIDRCPVLFINSENLDFQNQPDRVSEIAAEINRTTSGQRFYNPSV